MTLYKKVGFILSLFMLLAQACAWAERVAQFAPLEKGEFTIAVIPDTQYLFDQDRQSPEVLQSTLDWIVENSARHNIVFTVHLGDVVNNGANPKWGDQELAKASKVFETFDQNEIQYGVVAGNHDIDGGRLDNERGESFFLNYFTRERFQRQSSHCGSSSDGYNHCFYFHGAGQPMLLLALDWRVSAATIDWAKSTLAQFKDVPTIIATHEILTSANGDQTRGDAAKMTEYGRALWDSFIKSHNQIFLTLNGHNWPASRVTMKNAYQRDVFMHLVNYQDRFYSGSGMLRLYTFNLKKNSVDVRTFSPYWLSQPWWKLSSMAKAEAWLADSANRFTMELNFNRRFKPQPVVLPRPERSIAESLVRGTVAYWRFNGEATTPVAEFDVIEDLSGHGNDLIRVTLDNGDAASMTWSDEHHASAGAHGSIYLQGARPSKGAYLKTVSSAPINKRTFTSGYTFETFVRLPEYCCSSENHWMGVISRLGTGADLGRGPVNDQWEPNNPLATLTISPSREFQWAVAPETDPGLVTNWSFRTASSTWYHVAIVNDGEKTELYVNGAKDQRNPDRLSRGILSNDAAWLVGANHWMNNVDHGFHGWIGETRIVDRALSPHEFLLLH